MTNTIEISISNLRNHPNNVRKSYNGISELAASIKENGILQNLTVVPDPDNEGMYLVVIGNRRLQAAKKAGLETVPCVITDMAESDQALTMLTENMQRKDLTLIEESSGFQMCLEDFGIDVGTLASKTGFSKTTVRHRLNIAKLDRGILKDKMDDPEFQLSITDLALLEKVKNVEKRNAILDEAEDSRDLSWMVEQAVREENLDRAAKKLASLAKKESIAEAPENVRSEQYSDKWDLLASFTLDSPLPDHLLDDEERGDHTEDVYYLQQGTLFKIIAKHIVKTAPAQDDTTDSSSTNPDASSDHSDGASVIPSGSEESSLPTTDNSDSSTAPEEPAAPSEYELKEMDRKARHSEFNDLNTAMTGELKAFCRHMVACKVEKPEDVDAFTLSCWNMLKNRAISVSDKSLTAALLDKNYYSVKDKDIENVAEQAAGLPLYTQMTALLTHNICDLSLMNYYAHYNEESGLPMIAFHDLLSVLGFSFSDDAYDELMNGTHSVYLVEDTSDDDDSEYDDFDEDGAEYSGSDADDAVYDESDEADSEYDEDDSEYDEADSEYDEETSEYDEDDSEYDEETNTTDFEVLSEDTEDYTKDEYANAA